MIAHKLNLLESDIAAAEAIASKNDVTFDSAISMALANLSHLVARRQKILHTGVAHHNGSSASKYFFASRCVTGA